MKFSYFCGLLLVPFCVKGMEEYNFTEKAMVGLGFLDFTQNNIDYAFIENFKYGTTFSITTKNITFFATEFESGPYEGEKTCECKKRDNRLNETYDYSLNENWFDEIKSLCIEYGEVSSQKK